MKDYITSPKRRRTLLKIARYCANLRRSAGITQEEVANAVGCSKSNVSAFEHGQNDSATIYQWYLSFEQYETIVQTSGQRSSHDKNDH